MAKGSSETPLMKQFNEIKGKYPDALLLFRVGDFYETFGEDAIKASKVLGIVLTKRANGQASHIELAGFPHHSLDTYLPKLVRAGMRVAVCDQLEDPKATKMIVKRGVTDLVTPGIAYNDKILDHKNNNFLACIHFDGKNAGIAFIDVSTGEYLVAEGSYAYIDKLLQSFRPTEVIFEKSHRKLFLEQFSDKFYTYTLDDWIFKTDFARDLLLKHFGTASLKGFGVEDLSLGIVAAGAVLHYLNENMQDKTAHIAGIARIDEDRYVWLDRFTIRNLELSYSLNENAVTLIDIIDKSVTPMGSRLMKRWVALPLKDRQPIEDRLEVVDYFLKNKDLSIEITGLLKQVGDLERIISRVSVLRISPRELYQLKKALQFSAEIKKLCDASKNPALKTIGEQLNNCTTLVDRIAKELNAEAPVLVNKGNVINEGVNAELDDLRKIAYSGKDYLLQIQKREVERTGITSLKVAFNNVFGYYLEVTHAHKDKVPTDWIRKQTLVNAERYITPELKEYEEKILGAEDKIFALETKLFNDLVLASGEYIKPVQLNASLLARLDCLLSFATLAEENNYTKPAIEEDFILDIRNGRHPVIEKQLPVGEAYIANDIYLDNTNQQIIVITGPNMSGKSALLRQTALIVLLAQMGSFVPASSARIGLVDKLFTRVGASDNISSGESTFMVEMNETASILNNLTNRSLVLLDEIGRGTSTYDGISIAWAIAEFIHEHPTAKAKTLFATHYHELNDMADEFNRIKNYNVSVKEANGKVHFLRKLTPGGSEHSFGIHVAKMAGMPAKVLARANEILKQLEQTHAGGASGKPDVQAAAAGMQLSFFQLNDPVLEQIQSELQGIDINTLTPVEALMKLNEIKKLLGK
jgi:DNA mismatch repair protein MutS